MQQTMTDRSVLDWALFIGMVAVLWTVGILAARRQDRNYRARVTPVPVPRTGYRLMGGNDTGPTADTVAPTNGLSEFEQDRVARLNARYAQARAAVGSTGSALVNGSIGGSVIPTPPGYVVDYGAVGYGAPTRPAALQRTDPTDAELATVHRPRFVNTPTNVSRGAW